MKIIKNINYKKIKKPVLMAGLLCFIFIFLAVKPTGAAEVLQTAVATLLGNIAALFFTLIGWLLTFLINTMVKVASFSDIITVDAVKNGWVIVRDLCNMFFILILLVIAFATILRQENYAAKRLLPKLLIMAVIINFSKTIFGLIIDFSQVVMLTFVAGLGGDTATANFINIFKIQKMGQMADGWTITKTDSWATSAGIIAGVIALIITLIVVVVLLAVLLMRVIMLWIYTILSPLVFLGFAFPPIQKYTGKIWEDFIKQVIVGPMLAFFLWLALTTAGTSANKIGSGVDGIIADTGTKVCGGLNSLFCEGNFQTFIITIGLLLGGLMVTQSMGGAIAKAAGKATDWTKKGLMAPVKLGQFGGSYFIDKLHQRTALDVNVPRVWNEIKKKREERAADRYSEGQVKSFELRKSGNMFQRVLALTGSPATAYEQIADAGIRRTLKGGDKNYKKIQAIMENKENKKKEIDKILGGKDYKDKADKSNKLTKEQVIEHVGEDKFNQYFADGSPLLTRLGNLETALKNSKEKLGKKDLSFEGRREAEKEHKENEEIFNNELLGFNEIEKVIKDNSKDGKVQKENFYSEDEVSGFKQNYDEEIDRIKVLQKEVKKFDHQIADIKPLTDFEAIAAKESLVAREQKKISHVEDQEELGAMARDAQKMHNKYRLAAIAKKLTKDGNENDGLLNNFGFNTDQLPELMADFANKDSENYAGFSEQEAMSLGMEISYLAEKTGHWGIARTFKAEGGTYRAATKGEQAVAVASEVAKMDPQAAARTLNRLGYGAETPDGRFILNEVGLTILKTIGPQLTAQIKRMNSNTFARLSMDENINLMVKAKVDPKLIQALRGEGDSKEKIAPTIPAGLAKDQIMENDELLKIINKKLRA